MSGVFDRLVILEVANNHMGDVKHGLEIIRTFANTCRNSPFRLAFKFQYRHLDTFIHPDYRDRSDVKYVKRFSETRLAENDFLTMKDEVHKRGCVSVCTPFDEISVRSVVKHGYDIIKIASCSLTDWPLLEEIAETDKPVIASTAGAMLEDIDNAVNFFRNRNREFCLMHCIGAYPTPDSELELNQIDFLRQRYADIPVGFSTHEHPDNTTAVMMAIAKGSAVLERHVGIATPQYPLNQYSSTPQQINHWLQAAEKAVSMCGVSGRRRDISEQEASDLLGLRRGVFCRRDIHPGENLQDGNIYFAIPCQRGQLLANDLSKYSTFTARQEKAANAPVFLADVRCNNIRPLVLTYVREVCAILKAQAVPLGDKLHFELSHHYGLDEFRKWGCAIIDCVNREYCKKIIVLLPGQTNPVHAHKQKEETFNVLGGEVSIALDGVMRTYRAGEMIVVERGVKHCFSSREGAVFEEISTTHYKNDSFYDDEAITRNSARKTALIFRTSWLTKGVE